MSIPPHVISALTQFIHSSGLGGQAILIGGQAIRDWHAGQAHALAGSIGGIPTPRSTTDIDVHLVFNSLDPEAISEAIANAWTPDPQQITGRTFRFLWKQDESITLDLVALAQPGSRTRIEYLVKIGTGTEVGAVRVLAPWIMKCSLHERAFTPDLARLKVRRLTRLGLVASKITAVNTCVDNLLQAHRGGKAPPDWTSRLAKDLQDMDLLLRERIWVEDLWESHYQANETEICSQWSLAAEAFHGLQERPALMAEADFATMQRLVRFVPRRLILKAWEREG
jgi:hypothetical protein